MITNNPKELPDDIKDLITFLKFISSNLREPKTENEFGLKNVCLNIYGFDKKVLEILVKNQILLKTEKGTKEQFQWGKTEPNPLMAQAISNKLNEVIEKSIFDSLDEEDDFSDEQTNEQYPPKEKNGLIPYLENNDDITVLVTKNKRRRWEKFEMDYVEAHLNESAETLAIKLNRNLSSVENIIWKIKKTRRKESERNHNKFWEQHEIDFVAENITKPIDFLCEHLKRKRAGVLTMIDRLVGGELEYVLKNKGIVVEKKHYVNHHKRWTSDEIKFVATNIDEPFDFLVEKIQRTPIAVNFMVEAIKEGKHNHIIGEELSNKITSSSELTIEGFNEQEAESESEDSTVSKMEIVGSEESNDDLVLDEFKADESTGKEESNTSVPAPTENLYKESELIFILLNKNKPVEWFKDKLERSRHSIRKKLGDMKRGMYKDMIRGKSEEQLNEIIKRYSESVYITPTDPTVTAQEVSKQEEVVSQEIVIESEIKTETPAVEKIIAEPVKQLKRQNQNWNEAETEIVMEVILENPNRILPIAELSAVVERSEKAIEAMVWRLTVGDLKFKLDAFKQKKNPQKVVSAKSEQPIVLSEQGKEIKEEPVIVAPQKRIKKMSVLWGLFKWEKELKD